MAKNKIIIKSARNKEPFLVVKGGNNKTIVVSETYKSKQNVDKSIKALKKVIKNAKVIDKRKLT